MVIFLLVCLGASSQNAKEIAAKEQRKDFWGSQEEFQFLLVESWHVSTSLFFQISFLRRSQLSFILKNQRPEGDIGHCTLSLSPCSLGQSPSLNLGISDKRAQRLLCPHPLPYSSEVAGAHTARAGFHFTWVPRVRTQVLMLLLHALFPSEPSSRPRMVLILCWKVQRFQVRQFIIQQYHQKALVSFPFSSLPLS